MPVERRHAPTDAPWVRTDATSPPGIFPEFHGIDPPAWVRWLRRSGIAAPRLLSVLARPATRAARQETRSTAVYRRGTLMSASGRDHKAPARKLARKRRWRPGSPDDRDCLQLWWAARGGSLPARPPLPLPVELQSRKTAAFPESPLPAAARRA